MIGRGAYAPGEWTDATAMAIAVAEIASFASQLTVPQRLDDLVQRWAWWARNAKNVGPQTAAVLAPVDTTEGLAEAARDAAAAHFADTGGTLDATCLTRAVPVALFNLGPREEWSAVHAARTLCALTHAGPDAAVLWTLAVSHAVRTGELDLRIGLVQIEENRRDRWATRIAQAEQTHPADFAAATDDVVGVVQAAWSSITRPTRAAVTYQRGCPDSSPAFVVGSNQR
jgi:ADP-ribosylglycohydrolase